jgi:hypothetical protein
VFSVNKILQAICKSDTGLQTPDIRLFEKGFNTYCFTETLFSYERKERTIQVLFALLWVWNFFLHNLMSEV